MAKKKSGCAQMEEIAKRTQALGKLVAKLNASMTGVSDEAQCDPSAGAPSPEETEEQQRQDLTWLVGQQALIMEHQGNYVGVHCQTLVASAPSEQLVRISAAQRRGVNADQILVVPLKVPGSEELWAELQALMD